MQRKLGVGTHASDSLGQLPPDGRLTLCQPRVIEKLHSAHLNLKRFGYR